MCIDSDVELLCLETVDRVVVEYFGVSVGWVQQQQQQLEQQQPEPEQQQQQQLEQQQQQQRQERLLFWCRCALQRRFLSLHCLSRKAVCRGKWVLL